MIETRTRKLSDATFHLLDSAVAKRDLNSINSLLTRVEQMNLSELPEVKKAQEMQVLSIK